MIDDLPGVWLPVQESGPGIDNPARLPGHGIGGTRNTTPGEDQRVSMTDKHHQHDRNIRTGDGSIL